MKKTLMVLTFALCATFVFAQTMTPRMKGEYKASTKVATAQNEKCSSVFTKAGTPLMTCDFSSTAGYTTGIVSTGADAHGENYDFATWRRWANADSTTFLAASSIYSALAQQYFGDIETFCSYMMNYADTATSSAENGFMMMSLYDQRTQNSGNFNAYIAFNGIDASSASVVDVEFFQYYRKYYDKCYIDFSTNGTNWTATEINTTGVDIAVNGTLWGMATYTLPLAAAGNSNLSVRIRYYSLNSSRGAYGYFWLVDDVTVYAGEANRLKKYGQEFVEGGYGLIPQNMEMNPAWYSQVLNNGSATQNNVEAKLFHLNASQDNATLIASYDNGTIPATQFREVIVDRGGWILRDSLDHRGWFSYNMGHIANGTGIALPTDVAGDNYMYANVSNSNVSLNYDTMYYKVTSANQDGDYRWGHDNGVLTYNPYNYWLFGFVQQGGQWYVTEDAEEVNYFTPGYMVLDRFSTSENVPEGWVIRGVEFVASPVEGYHSTGAKISPILVSESYPEAGSVSFGNIATGANIKEITSADINDSTIIGRNSHGFREIGQYNTVYIPFPEQPALTPNTSYRVGYTLEEEGYFALAQQAQGSYRYASPTRPDRYDTIIYFKNEEANAKYASYFTPNQYGLYVVDPSYGGPNQNYIWAGSHVDYNPMIHLVVGPEHAAQRAGIDISCEGEEYGAAYYNGEEACGTTATPVEGSRATVSGEAQTGCEAVVTVNGEEVQPWDEETEEGDPNFRVQEYADGSTTYQYSFVDVRGTENAIHFLFREKAVDPTSIDPVAANVRMNLQPNPATSQVSLNIEGVNGTVNCTLIDMSGRVVYNQNINAESANTISLSNLAKGAYFVRITNDKFSKVEKLIVR